MSSIDERGKLKVHKGQKIVMHDPRRYRVIVAGRRWGKTRLSAISLIVAASSKRKQKIWYVAPTYQMARDLIWEDIKDAIPRAWVAKNGINETRMTILLVNGSKIFLKGADKPDSLRGVGIHFLVMDEVQDIKFDTWNKVLRPTLASTGGRVLFIGTPKSFNWFYDLFVAGQRGDTYVNAKGKTIVNAWKSWQFPTMTSPFIPRAEIEQARADMDEKSFNQEFNASFETMSGRVYYAFARAENVKPCPFNPMLPIYIGQDFNIDPMSSVIIQEQPNGEIWIVDEAVLYGSNTQETADEMQRRYYKHINQITFYPDPAGAGRSTAARGESDLDVLRESGFKRIKYKKKHPAVADRVNSVNRLFRTAEGVKRLYCDPKCKKTIEAFEQTTYKPGTREVNKTMGVEHPADAFGYYADLEHPMREIKILGVSL